MAGIWARRAVGVSLTLAAMLCLAAPAAAQTYPAKPIRVVKADDVKWNKVTREANVQVE